MWGLQTQTGRPAAPPRVRVVASFIRPRAIPTRATPEREGRSHDLTGQSPGGLRHTVQILSPGGLLAGDGARGRGGRRLRGAGSAGQRGCWPAAGAAARSGRGHAHTSFREGPRAVRRWLLPPSTFVCVTLQNKGTKKIGQKGYGHSGECYQTPAVVIVLSLPSNFHQIGFQLFSFFFSAHFVFGLQG